MNSEPEKEIMKTAQIRPNWVDDRRGEQGRRSRLKR